MTRFTSCDHDIQDVTSLMDTYFRGICVKCDATFIGPKNEGTWYHVNGKEWIPDLDKTSDESLFVEIERLKILINKAYVRMQELSDILESRKDYRWE